MVQLKQVSLRLKSIKNIQKITKTMKMVSASKFTRAERELSAARPFGYGPRKFYESTKLVKGPVDEPGGDKKKDAKAAKEPTQPAAELEIAIPEAKLSEKDPDKKLKRIYIAMTSDRGLCGGVHTGVARRLRRTFTERNSEGKTHKLVCVGEKSRSMLSRQYSSQMLISFRDIGRVAPTFKDAALVAAALTDSGYVYDVGEIYYNKFFSAVKYELNVMPFFNQSIIETAPNMVAFDDIEPDVLQSYAEWTLAAILFYVLKEGAASELSARMSAMENATNNAGDMIRRLTLLFNRTRQSVITRELIEIISGAAALK